MRALAVALILVVGFVLLVIFLRALSNLRSGSRVQQRRRTVERAAGLELEQLQAEMDAARRTAGKEATGGKE